jgi:hypothetical protein
MEIEERVSPTTLHLRKINLRHRERTPRTCVATPADFHRHITKRARHLAK